VFIIAYAYSRIIEHFPYGGGGYIVATITSTPRQAVIAGSALLVDYISDHHRFPCLLRGCHLQLPSPRLIALQDAFRRGVDYPSRFDESPWREKNPSLFSRQYSSYL